MRWFLTNHIMHVLIVGKPFKGIRESYEERLKFLEVEQNQQVKLKYKGKMTKSFITSVEFLQN